MTQLNASFIFVATGEHAAQLVDFLKSPAGTDVSLTGVVKDCDSLADQDGLLEFYNTYFHSYPIYQDSNWKLHHCMSDNGNLNMGLWGLVTAVLRAKPRWRRKRIQHSPNLFRTDPWMVGGVMIFDKRDNLIYAVEETVGQELDMERIARAVQGARNINDACADEEQVDGDETDEYFVKKEDNSEPDTSTNAGSSNGSDSGLGRSNY